MYQMKTQRVVKSYRVRESVYEKASEKARKEKTTLAKKIENFIKRLANEKREN